MLFTADCGGLLAWLPSTSTTTNQSFVAWTLMACARLPFWRDVRFGAPRLKCNHGCVVSYPVRRKRPWCTTPSTWLPPPLNAPPRSPSAPSSATDTNPGASDHASWTCSKTWVRCSGPLSVVIHPSSTICIAALPPHQFPWAAGAETEELGNQIRRVCDGGVSSNNGVDAVGWPESVSLKRQFTRDSKLVFLWPW